MRQRVTLIIVRDEKILAIHRQRDGRSYYVIPGGGVEPGESLAQAALREAKEETSLDIELGPLLYTRPWTDGRFRQTEYAFLVTSYRGQPILRDPEMLARQSPENSYTLQWVSIADLDGQGIYPGPIELDGLKIED